MEGDGRGRISLGVLCVISCSGKPHLKPAFCFLNTHLIPSLMIYDKEDQCTLQVKVARLCVGVHVCTHPFCARTSVGARVCLCVCALSLMGYMLSNNAETGAAAGYVTPHRRERLREESQAGGASGGQRLAG